MSEINKGLNEYIKEFRERKLTDTYSIIWIDALYEKIRFNHSICNMAVLVVCGVKLDGKREILAVEPMYEESELSYKTLFDNLKFRRLQNVLLAVSDAHKGLVAAIQNFFIGCIWKQCKVHFIRNIMAHIPAKEKILRGEIKTDLAATGYESVKRYANQIINEYGDLFLKPLKPLKTVLKIYCNTISSRELIPGRLVQPILWRD